MCLIHDALQGQASAIVPKRLLKGSEGCDNRGGVIHPISQMGLDEAWEMTDVAHRKARAARAKLC